MDNDPQGDNQVFKQWANTLTIPTRALHNYKETARFITKSLMGYENTMNFYSTPYVCHRGGNHYDTEIH